MDLKLTLTITICALIGIISSHAFIPENENIQTSEAQNIPYKLEANRNLKKNKSTKQISCKIQKLNVYKAIGDCLSSKFSASKAVDGNLSTCWAMNLDNAVVDCDQYGGPTFYLNCKQLCYVIIHNGFSKTKALSPSLPVICSAIFPWLSSRLPCSITSPCFSMCRSPSPSW